MGAGSSLHERFLWGVALPSSPVFVPRDVSLHICVYFSSAIMTFLMGQSTGLGAAVGSQDDDQTPS